MAVAAPAPLPAAVPAAFFANNNEHGNKKNAENGVLPLAVGAPPPLSNKMANWAHSEKFFVCLKNRSHGKQHIARYLRSLGYCEQSFNQLPDKTVIFYWVQREYLFENVNYMQTPLNRYPIIAYINSQLTMCEKVKMAENLLNYYGSDYAWQITPETYDALYDFDKKYWYIDHLKTILNKKNREYINYNNDKRFKHTWIVKSNIGSLGNEVFLWQGDTIEQFRTFLHNKFDPDLWKEMLEAQEISREVRINMVILQTYVDRPLLFKNKYKFDLRVYVLTACCDPTIVFFHIGKMRLCAVEYQPFEYKNDNNKNNNSNNKTKSLHDKNYKSDESELYSHLTNCKIQRCHENYDHITSQIDGQSMLADWDEFIKFMYDISIKEKHFVPQWFDPTYDTWDSKYNTQFGVFANSKHTRHASLNGETNNIKTKNNSKNNNNNNQKKNDNDNKTAFESECKDNNAKNKNKEKDYSKYPNETEFGIKEMEELMTQKCMNLVGKTWNSIGDIYDNDTINTGRACQFAFHGIDILIDDNGQFWLIEINRCPSLSLIGFNSIKNMTKEMLNECVNIELKIRDIKKEFYQNNENNNDINGDDSKDGENIKFNLKNKPKIKESYILNKLNEAGVIKHWRHVPLQYLNDDFKRMKNEKSGIFKGLKKNSNVQLLNNVEKIKNEAPTHSVL